MSEFKLYEMQIGQGIEACLEKELDVAAQVLIYSGIDIVGWLASADEFASDRTFIEWAKNYLLKAKPLPWTALDLWGARCGLVHTLMPFSRPSKKGQPRIICPAVGTARAEDFQAIIDVRGDSDRYVSVHVNDLYEAWRLGVARFVDSLERDPERKARIYAKAGKCFSRMSTEVLTLARAAFEQREKEPKAATE
jgi:hypothetical protein